MRTSLKNIYTSDFQNAYKTENKNSPQQRVTLTDLQNTSLKL